MKSLVAHYMNKYPGGHCEPSDAGFRAYDANGKLRVVLEKGGDGMMHDISEQYGLEDRHDLAPIPKDSRLFKVRDGKVAKDELHDERMELHKEFVQDGKVLSCAELKEQGYAFCDKQTVTRRPEFVEEESVDESTGEIKKKKVSKSKKK